MSTPTEEGLTESPDQAEKPVNAESAVPALEAVKEELPREGESDSEFKERLRFEAREKVDPRVLADQPQPAPPAPPRRLRFTVLCGRKEGDNAYRRDIAAVHIMGVDLAEARVNAITLLAANVKDTTVDDWEPIIGYLGHLEIL